MFMNQALRLMSNESRRCWKLPFASRDFVK